MTQVVPAGTRKEYIVRFSQLELSVEGQLKCELLVQSVGVTAALCVVEHLGGLLSVHFPSTAERLATTDDVMIRISGNDAQSGLRMPALAGKYLAQVEIGGLTQPHRGTAFIGVDPENFIASKSSVQSITNDFGRISGLRFQLYFPNFFGTSLYEANDANNPTTIVLVFPLTSGSETCFAPDLGLGISALPATVPCYQSFGLPTNWGNADPSLLNCRLLQNTDPTQNSLVITGYGRVLGEGTAELWLAGTQNPLTTVSGCSISVLAQYRQFG